jgi:hypothetical protein
MSRIADESLIRSVYQLFFSDVNDSFASSYIESKDEMESLRSGADMNLRACASFSCKNSIGWIDSAGKLIEGTYPNLQALIKGFRRKQPPRKSRPPQSRPFLRQSHHPRYPSHKRLLNLKHRRSNATWCLPRFTTEHWSSPVSSVANRCQQALEKASAIS